MLNVFIMALVSLAFGYVAFCAGGRERTAFGAISAFYAVCLIVTAIAHL
jgi:hypothetical protein